MRTSQSKRIVISKLLFAFFQETLYKPLYQNILKSKDATHLVSEVTIGSNLNIDVKYELSTEEDRSEIEGILSGAINMALANLSLSGEGQYIKQNIDQTGNLDIQIYGTTKQIHSISNVSTH